MSDYYSDPYQNDYKAWLIGGIVFSIIFLAIFGVGCYLLVRQIQASRYMAIESVVVDHRIVYENDTGSIGGNFPHPVYYNVVEYEVNGQTYRKTCDTSASTNTPPETLGDIITIYVNPKNPQDVVFRNSTHILLTVLCLVVPLGGSVGVVFIFRKANKIKKDM